LYEAVGVEHIDRPGGAMPRLEFKPVNRLKSESIWLTKHFRNVASANGQDGLFEKIFEIIGPSNRWCVEFGAVDGKTGSNTWHMINNHGWSGVLIEADPALAKELRDNYRGNQKVHTFETVVTIEGENAIDSILSRTPIPADFDLCSIDIDGNDYHVWKSMTKYRPRVVCIEFNYTAPNDVIFVQDPNPDTCQGCSLLALIELGKEKGYELVAATAWDGVFVDAELYAKFGIEDNSIDAMWNPHMRELKILQGFDGTLYTAGSRILQESKIAFEHDELQIVPKSMRKY